MIPDEPDRNRVDLTVLDKDHNIVNDSIYDELIRMSPTELWRFYWTHSVAMETYLNVIEQQKRAVHMSDVIPEWAYAKGERYHEGKRAKDEVMDDLIEKELRNHPHFTNIADIGPGPGTGAITVALVVDKINQERRAAGLNEVALHLIEEDPTLANHLSDYTFNPVWLKGQLKLLNGDRSRHSHKLRLSGLIDVRDKKGLERLIEVSGASRLVEGEDGSQLEEKVIQVHTMDAAYLGSWHQEGFEPESMDLIYSKFSAHHIPPSVRKRFFFNTLSKYLSDDGLLLIGDEHISNDDPNAWPKYVVKKALEKAKRHDKLVVRRKDTDENYVLSRLYLTIAYLEVLSARAQYAWMHGNREVTEFKVPQREFQDEYKEVFVPWVKGLKYVRDNNEYERNQESNYVKVDHTISISQPNQLTDYSKGGIALHILKKVGKNRPVTPALPDEPIR
jgi:hypothetical protein